MRPGAADVIDDRMIRGLHVEAVRHRGLAPEHESHVVFQTSTLDALFEGGFDGDLTFAELAGHGDLGIGTLNGLDGETIAVDGRFLRADADGNLSEVDPSARTPFAVATFFESGVEFALQGPLDHGEMVAEIDRHARPGTPVCAAMVGSAFPSTRRAWSWPATTCTSSTRRGGAVATC